jgi:hypothetical protein
MANRFPLIVDSSNQNIKELPDGDSLLLGDSEKLLLGDGTDLQLYHDGSNSYLANSTGALKLATETSGIAITIGHSTSETTIGDNLVITGDLSVGGVTLPETIADTVGAMVSSNTESGITVAYDDADNTLDFTVGTLNQDTTGSAATLTTARTIGGVSFDGSANITPTTFTTASFSGAVTAATSAKITQVALTSSSNAVAWDAAAAANAYHVTTENTTFSAPSNAVEGAIISVELAQGGTARTVAWNTVFEFAASTAPTVTATASKTDIFAFRYNGSVWQEIGRVQNMAQTYWKRYNECIIVEVFPLDMILITL